MMSFKVIIENTKVCHLAVDTLQKLGLLREQHKDLLSFQFGRPADAGNTHFPILLSLKGDFPFDTSHGP